MESEDEFRWLEDIEGEQPMAWVLEQNERTRRELASDPRFEKFYREALAALNDDSRIPDISLRRGYIYNLWQDALHPRGLYRRMPADAFIEGGTDWQPVIDVDALAASEGKAWAFRGMTCAGSRSSRCLVSLSPGGSDAAELREFDLDTLEFVPAGFSLPAGKHRVEWRDENHLYVAPDLGEAWRTTSGYPRKLLAWKRGEPIDAAKSIYEGNRESVSVSAQRFETRTGPVDIVVEGTTFWTRKYLGVVDENELATIDIPPSATVEGAFDQRLVFRLHEPWQIGTVRHAPGSLLIAAPGQPSAKITEVEVLFEPDGRRVIEDVTIHKQGIILSLLDNVRARVRILSPAKAGWDVRDVPLPDNGSVVIDAVDKETGDFFARFESFTTPPTLYFISHESPIEPRIVRRLAPTFDADEVTVSQRWTPSADGTRIPYFVVAPRELELDGTSPVHIFAYGGFRNAVLPSYSGTYEDTSGAYGKLWLERGGVFVIANIRGGGEFGPAWHSAALEENRHKAFEDFEAVASDLVERGVTSRKRIGIEGRSNGGLLVAATMIRRPELYGAVICGVPLADMRRYHELLAGASWVGEYGNPDDPDDWAFIKDYSPYQNLDPSAEYPPVFFYTSTRDDRVHPGHARKMMARMRQQGHEAWYYENTEGGHGGSVTSEDLAYRLALAYVHLWRSVGK